MYVSSTENVTRFYALRILFIQKINIIRIFRIFLLMISMNSSKSYYIIIFKPP